ncbi:glycine cleavage system protein H [Eremococcus coleocola]|uniref:Biotin-requiring enzyme n=1 Tax=Eremococcus coleocola ACS-139-V-Col8 TaxID=908337 RepID=E4KNZ4_9LACT|nr:glycine cleavage system protein H [Eremococcus coleocola]EFR31179.1 Biotin-requiring enzyme [Eremococcus coleocola ACS-139-V-Col8]
MNVEYLWQKEASGQIVLGVNEVLQEEVGEIVYANIARLGEIAAGDTLLNVEASKATIEIPSPISGKIVVKHVEAENNPSLLDSQDEEKNWIVKIEA